MKASDTPKSVWQYCVEDVWAWCASLATWMPDCPVLRGVTASVLHVQSEVLKGVLRVTDYLLAQVETPEPPRSEHIPIE
jgi:hypothetical protein